MGTNINDFPLLERTSGRGETLHLPFQEKCLLPEKGWFVPSTSRPMGKMWDHMHPTFQIEEMLSKKVVKAQFSLPKSSPPEYNYSFKKLSSIKIYSATVKETKSERSEFSNSDFSQLSPSGGNAIFHSYHIQMNP